MTASTLPTYNDSQVPSENAPNWVHIQALRLSIRATELDFEQQDATLS